MYVIYHHYTEGRMCRSHHLHCLCCICLHRHVLFSFSCTHIHPYTNTRGYALDFYCDNTNRLLLQCLLCARPCTNLQEWKKECDGHDLFCVQIGAYTLVRETDTKSKQTRKQLQLVFKCYEDKGKKLIIENKGHTLNTEFKKEISEVIEVESVRVSQADKTVI